MGLGGFADGWQRRLSTRCRRGGRRARARPHRRATGAAAPRLVAGHRRPLTQLVGLSSTATSRTRSSVRAPTTGSTSSNRCSGGWRPGSSSRRRRSGDRRTARIDAVPDPRRGLRQRRPGLRRDAFRRALQLEPGVAAVHAALAEVLTRLNRYAEAATHLRRALTLDPKQEQALALQMELLVAEGLVPEAIGRFVTATANGASARIITSFGDLLARLGLTRGGGRRLPRGAALRRHVRGACQPRPPVRRRGPAGRGARRLRPRAQARPGLGRGAHQPGQRAGRARPPRRGPGRVHRADRRPRRRRPGLVGTRRHRRRPRRLRGRRGRPPARGADRPRARAALRHRTRRRLVPCGASSWPCCGS